MTTPVDLNISGWFPHPVKPTFDGLSPTEARPVISTSYAGVPDPDFGATINDPRFYVSPGVPGSWTSNTVGQYYVTQAGTNVGNGYPTNPSGTIPTTLAAGDILVLSGTLTGGSITIACSGTAANPVWIIADGTVDMQRITVVSGTYVLVDEISWSSINESVLTHGTNSSYICVRGGALTGDGVQNNNGSGYSAGGSSGADNDHIVFYDMVVSNFGDYTDLPTAIDKHGVKPRNNIQDHWIIGCTIFHNGGDGVQTSEASGITGTDRPTRIYIAGNSIYANRENAIDIKTTLDVIISQNICYDYVASASSPGEVIVIHNNADNVWVIFNDVSQGNIGVITTGSTNTWVIGNKIHNIHRPSGDAFDPNSGYSSGACIHFRSSGSTGGAVGNTLFNYDLGIQLTQGGASGYVCESNLFKDRSEATGYDIRTGESDVRAGSSLDNNLFHHASGSTAAIMNESNVISTPTAWNTTNSNMSNTVESDPLLVNTGTNDFHLGAGSPAIDAGLKSSPYATFFARYGISIEVDFDGVALPATSTDTDAGCLQRVA